jgi:hypothetical protein
MKRSFVLFAAAALGCNPSPAEPTPTPTASAGPAQPAATVTDEPAPKELGWSPPPGWTIDKAADAKDARVRYTIPPVGNDAEPAELQVRFLGRGAQADFDGAVSEWAREFDGNVAADATRQQFDVGSIHLRTVEIAGTYQKPLGPPLGPGKRAAAYQIKKGWRSILGAADAGSRGVWLFRLLGPDDTVQAARSGMDSLLRSVR